jgi:hypothetical protein
MTEQSKRGDFHDLPQAVQSDGDIPAPMSVARIIPNIVLRNDGFSAGTVYLLEQIYMLFAPCLPARGIMLQEQTPGRLPVTVTLLMNWAGTDPARGERELSTALSVATWTDFQVACEDPLDYASTPASWAPALNPASIVIAYGSDAVLAYAHRHAVPKAVSARSTSLPDSLVMAALQRIVPRCEQELARPIGQA